MDHDNVCCTIDHFAVPAFNHLVRKLVVELALAPNKQGHVRGGQRDHVRCRAFVVPREVIRAARGVQDAAVAGIPGESFV